MELQHIKFMSPASFEKVEKPDSIQTVLILGLLKKHIESGTPITIEDIRGIHAEYSMKRDMHRAGYIWDKTDPAYPEGKWRKSKTKDEWLNNWSSKERALPWFRNGLGMAIIKGRILAIPVIDIEKGATE